MTELGVRSWELGVGKRAKKGQVGDTVTWVVATIVIVVILVFFIFGASLLATTKTIKYKSSLFSVDEKVGDDIFLKKSLFAYHEVQRDNDKKKIISDLEKRAAQKEFDVSYNTTSREIRTKVGNAE